MLGKLKLVILDYPKYLAQEETPKHILSDIIQAKQINYGRTDDLYVPISGLDIVGTHILIYDISDVFKPKLILAIRNLYENRVKKHYLSLPFEDAVSHLSSDIKDKYFEFKKNKPSIADCGAFFIDPEYSFKKTNFPIAEIGMMMMINHLLKNGYSHLVATTNLTFKTTRWVEPIGFFEKGIIFTHNLVKQPHELILLEPFNYRWLMNCYEKYFDLWKQRAEYKPNELYLGQPQISDEALYNLVINNAQFSRAI